ncbi:MAG: sigma-54-dependent Fis family transcriptional regulator, partial [Bacteroidales bacterium]|nr:sigma-54-dependent Fis family transcriptional regulator [Bacteroidales bacterium]
EKIEFFMKEYLPDIILLDMNFRKDAISGQEGFEWLEKILKMDKDAVVILMTAYSDTEKAVKAIKSGATDFITKPWENEKLLATLSSGIKLRRSRKEVGTLEEQVAVLANEKTPLPQIIGESESICRIFSTAEKLGSTDTNVLLLGENGTGKDLIAQLLHRNSLRCNRPFVHIDLGSIPEQLFESELFGYEKGAFTDAKKAKPGRMEIANKGTLFLNEIGNLPLQAQAKLLTALESKRITRLGGTSPIEIDVRVICATNADLPAMVENGTFREDLFYRINTIELSIPPLRERGNDIILLAEHFTEKYSHKYGKKVPRITREAKEHLLKYTWPGNVRELQHIIERAVILGNGHSLLPDDLALKHPQRNKGKEPANLNLKELEQQAIDKAMELSDGNMNKAAELLGITRYALYRKLK